MNSEKAGRTKVLASRIVIFIPIVASLVAILKDGPSVLETYFDKTLQRNRTTAKVKLRKKQELKLINL